MEVRTYWFPGIAEIGLGFHQAYGEDEYGTRFHMIAFELLIITIEVYKYE